MPDEKIIRTLVLSGGGVKGAYQIGALQRLYEAPSFAIDATFGVSTGSLTSALLAQAQPGDRSAQLMLLDTAAKVYTEIKGNKSIYDGGHFLPGQILRFLTKDALYNPKGLRKILARVIRPEALESGMPFGAGVVECESGDYLSIGNTANVAAGRRPGPSTLLDYILGSGSMPVYFPAVKVGQMSYIDGGVRNQTPLGDAMRWLRMQRADRHELYVILTNPLTIETRHKKWRGPSMVGRALSIALNEVYREDLDSLATRNANHRPGDVTVDAYVGIPAVHYGDALDFDPKKIRQMMADGRSRPLRFLGNDPITLWT